MLGSFLPSNRNSIKRWSSILLLLIILIPLSTAQQDSKIDSLLQVLAISNDDTNKVNLLNDLSTHYASISNTDAAKQYAEEAASLAVKKQFTRGITIAQYNLGMLWYNQGNYDEARIHFEPALQGSGKLHDQKRMANTYRMIAIIQYYQSNYDEALAAYSAELKIQDSLDNQKAIANNLTNTAAIYLAQSNYPEALNYLLRCRETSEAIGYDEGIASSYNGIGIIYDFQGNFPKAVESYLAAMKIQEKTGHQAGHALTQTNLAIIYRSMGEIEKAMALFLASLEIFRAQNDTRNMALCYYHIGLTHKDYNQYPEARKYLKDALDMYLEIGDQSGASVCYSSLGIMYHTEQNWPEALDQYKLALAISKEIGDQEAISNHYLNIGKIYIETKRYEEARQYLMDGTSLAKELGATIRVIDGYEHLAMLDSILGAWEDAYRHHQLYVYYNDSIYNEENTKKLVQAQMQYEFGKREDSLRLQQALTDKNLIQQTLLAQQRHQSLLIKDNELLLTLKENDLQALEIEKKQSDYLAQKAETIRKQDQLALMSKEAALQLSETQKQKQLKNYFIGSLLLFGLLSFFVYNNYITRQKLKLQTLRNKIASDLHDDVGSTLSSISIFSAIARQRSGVTDPMLTNIEESSKKMLEAMGDIVWAIKPENDNFERVVLRMRSFAYQLLGAMKLDFEFDVDEHITKVNVPMDVRKNVYLIFKEATNNLAKYAQASKAQFSIRQVNDHLTLLVRDNGKGFDVNEANEGNGLRNMRQRAREIGGHLDIDSQPGEGTSIKLRVAV